MIKMLLLKIFCVILLTSLRNTNGMNSQIVYEKCRGPGKFVYVCFYCTAVNDASQLNIMPNEKCFCTYKYLSR